MRYILATALALMLVSPAFAMGQSPGYLERANHRDNRYDKKDRDREGREHQQQQRQDYNRGEQRQQEQRQQQDRSRPRWSRGDRLPQEYRQRRYYVQNWQQYGLRKPPRGYRWVRSDNYDFFLAAIATGIIGEVIYRDTRDQRWRQRYSREYTYHDDIYYRECRNGPDPAGVIMGALIGGLLGHAAAGRDDKGAATMAGVIIGGALGAALTSDLDCADRSYAYRSYYDGFNAGRPNTVYRWRNPHNNHRGEFRVNNYFNDPAGFHCANFSQIVIIQGRQQEARGVACRQPDGAWAIVNR